MIGCQKRGYNPEEMVFRHPSMVADSSISRGMFLMKPWKMKIDSGLPNPRYANTIPPTVPSKRKCKNSPITRIQRTKGYIKTWKGMTMAETKAMKRMVDQESCCAPRSMQPWRRRWI